MSTMLQDRQNIFLAMVVGILFLSFGCSPKDENGASPIASGTAVETPKKSSGVVEGAKTNRVDTPSSKSSDKGVPPKSPLSPAKDKAPSMPEEGSAEDANEPSKSTPPVATDASLEVLEGIPKPPKGLDILAVVAVDSLARIEDVVTVVNGAPKKKGDIARDAVEDFKKKFGFKDASWLRSDGPLYVMLSDIKEETGGRALVLPITDAKVVKRALKSFKKKGSKHLGELVVDGKKAYVDLSDDQVVISYTDTFFSRLDPYLKGAFKGYKPKAVVELQMNIQALRKMYGKDLSGSKGWIQKSIAGLFDLGNLQGLEGQGVENVVSLVNDFIESVAEAGVALTLEKGAISFVAGVVPEKGQDLEKIIADMKNLRSQLAASVHPQALMALTANLGRLALMEGREESQKIVAALAPVVKLDAKEKAVLLDILEKRRLNQLGDGIFQVYQDGAFPLAMGGAAVVKDAAVERQSHQQFLDLAFKILMKSLRTQMKDNRMASLFLKSNSFSDLFGSMSMITNPMGITLEVTSREIKGTTVDAFTVKIDWDKSPLAARIPNADLIRKTVGDSLSIAAAYRGKRMALAFGPNASAHARTMVDDKGFGGQSSLTQIAQSHAIAGHVRLGAIAKLLLQFAVPRTPELLALSAMGDETALQVKAKSNGSKAVFRVTVPAPLFRVFR